jgi:hypothetical protein
MKKTSLVKASSYFIITGALTAAGYFYGVSSAQSGAKSAASAGKPHAASATGYKGALSNARLNMDSKASLDDFMKMKGKPDATDLAIWARGLSPEECAAALASLQTQPAGNPRDLVLDAVMKSWASRDPKGFLSVSDSMTIPRLREAGVDAALKALATQNPQDALQWLKDNPGAGSNANQQARVNAALSGYAASDPTGAFNFVSSMTDGTPATDRAKNQALQALVSGVADSGNFSGALAMFGQMPDGPQKNQALQALGQSWTQSNPVDASNWINTLTDPGMKNQLSNQLLASWSGSDPAAAAAWATSMDATASAGGGQNCPGNNANSIAGVISTWAGYDLNAAGLYLNTMAASSEKDAAVASFAIQAGQQDPQSAMNWVNTVSDPGVKERLALVTALQWEQTDANGANQFISTTDILTDADKSLIANIPPPILDMLSGNGPGGPGGPGGGPGGAGPGGGGPGGGRGGPGGGPGGGVTGLVQNYIINGDANMLNGPGGRGGRGGGG